MREKNKMNPIIPMWALTGHPTTERLVAELEKYKKSGIDRILLYPRYGYEYEYMGEEWRRICYDCILYAHTHGMKIWLYDEVNWPSGSCAGKVGRVDEDYRAKRIANQNGELVVEIADPDTCKFAVDILNPSAVDCFISLTHEKYYEWFGEYFGGAVEGIFTDEPGFSYFAEAEKPAYYDGSFEDYKKAYDRDAETDFISGCAEFYPNWYDLLGKKFRESYLGRIENWCKTHKLKLTGHLLFDNYVCRGVHSSGDLLKALDSIDVCGVDEIWNNPVPNHMDFAFSQISCIRRHGKKDAMAELFAYGPASLPYIRMRQMIWYAAVYGVNHFFTAIAHFDIRGNRVRKDFFHDFSPSSPDFEVGAPLLGASAAEAAEYADKTPAALVSVRYPYRAALEASGKFGKECQAGKFLWALTEALAERQITFALIAEEDQSETEICFEISNEIIKEISSGAMFTNAAEAADSCVNRVTRPVMLFEKDGSLAKNVLVRTYNDGSFAAIETGMDTNSPERALVLRRNGMDKSVKLPSSGVITDKTLCHELEREEVKIGELNINHNAPNVLRAEFFLSNEYKFTLEKPLALTFVRRDDKEEATVLLDGKKLDFCKECDCLPIAAKEFYKNTESMLIEAGEHIVSTDAAEITHFPVLLILGDFYESECVLRARSKDYFDGIPFYSKISVGFEADIPKEESSFCLSFEDNRLVSELSINGEKVGSCAYAPYVYEIPPKYKGEKIKFELSFYSGYAPLFGDLCAVSRRKQLSTNDTFRYSIPEKLVLSDLCIRKYRLS